MFSLVSRTTTGRHLVRMTGRRLVSGAPVGVSNAVPTAKPPVNKALPKAYQYSFQKSWLSDPSTYPLLGAMMFGTALIVGFSVNALTRYRGVKISSTQKHAAMPLEREQDARRTTPLTEVLAGGPRRAPTSFHARKYTTLSHEGLGVDHEAWKNAKEAKRSDQQ